MRSRVVRLVVVGLISALMGGWLTGELSSPSAAPSGVTAATSDEAMIVRAVKRVQPSVVALTVIVNGRVYVPLDPFSELFGGPRLSRPQTIRTTVAGSGFVYSRDGLIITNSHVVSGGGLGRPSKIDVLFANGDNVTARLVASDASADIALVKVDGYAKLPPPLEFGNSDALQAGQWAIAIGEPLELKQTVTLGVVSGFHRDEVVAESGRQPRIYKDLLQTSAPINPGNSGGPLIDTNGRLIGVNQITASPAAAQGIGFAIPSNVVRDVAITLAKRASDSRAAPH